MIDKTVAGLATAVADIRDGATVMIGGFGTALEGFGLRQCLGWNRRGGRWRGCLGIGIDPLGRPYLERRIIALRRGAGRQQDGDAGRKQVTERNRVHCLPISRTAARATPGSQ